MLTNTHVILIASTNMVARMETALSVLTVIAQLAAVALIVALIIARVRPDGGAAAALDRLSGSAISLAWVVAAVATAGSLWFQFAAHFVPCELCWFQRIAMYPLAALLAIAALTRDTRFWIYGLCLALIGGTVSVYHYQLERFPTQHSLACEAANPCTAIWFERFGYITLSMMALSGFCVIAALMLVARRADTHPQSRMQKGR